MPTPPTITVASYNMRKAIGTDRRITLSAKGGLGGDEAGLDEQPLGHAWEVCRHRDRVLGCLSSGVRACPPPSGA